MLRKAVCSGFEFESKSSSEIRIHTPFTFDDGDTFSFRVIELENGKYKLTDNGDTMLHLSYRDEAGDFNSGTRLKLREKYRQYFGVTEDQGEMTVETDEAGLTEAFFNLSQYCLKLGDLTFLNKEHVASTFKEDVKHQLQELAAKYSVPVTFDQYLDRDTRLEHPIDCIIPRKTRPLYVFAVNNLNKCLNTTIGLLFFEKWNVNFEAAVIYEDQTELANKEIATLSDLIIKQISNLGQFNRFEQFLASHLAD
jgi:hypothetical protein